MDKMLGVSLKSIIQKLMGHKKLCLDCRLSLNRDFDPGSDLKYPCPNCGNAMLLLPHRFRAQKKPMKRAGT